MLEEFRDPSRVSKAVAFGVVALIAVVLAAVSYALIAERKEILADTEATARNLARVVDEQAAGSINATDVTLASIARALPLLPGGAAARKPEVDAFLRSNLEHLPFVRALWVLDASGEMVHGSDAPPGRYNLADRAYFRAHRDQPGLGLYLDAPIAGIRGIWFVAASRRIERPDGSFAGVVTAAIEPRYFDRFYESIAVGHEGVIALLRPDGALVARAPAADAMRGKVPEPRPAVLDYLRASPEGTYRTVSRLDGIERIYAYRKLRDRPLVVVAGLGVAESLAAWRRTALANGLGSLAFVLTIGALGILVRRELRRRSRLDQSLQRFRAAMDISGDAVLLIDRKSLRYVDVNQSLCDMLGYTREEILAMTPMELFSADRATLERDYDALIADSRSPASHVEGYYRRKDGTRFPIETRRRALLTKEGWIIVGTARDISERKEAEEKIGRLNRVHAMLSSINAAIVRIRERHELFDESCRIAAEAGGFEKVWIGLVDRDGKRIEPVAWRGSEAAVRRLREMRFELRPADAEPMGIVDELARSRRAVVVNDVAADPRIRDAAGLAEIGIRSIALFPLVVEDELLGLLALHSDQAGFFDEAELRLLVELAGDIAFALDHIEKSERVDYLAFYDELTGLANRHLFLERLSQFLNAAGQAGEKLALAVVDVERMRGINESLGRQAGDALLKELARRLEKVADRAELARISADHFAIVLPGVKGKSAVLRRIERLRDACFGAPFELEGRTLRIAARAGLALFPADAVKAEGLIAAAEAALRRARQTGEPHVFHAAEMTARSAEKLALENRLHQAIEREEFVLHYQPKIEVATRRIVGVEALIRWQSPEQGLVPPMRFIPLMEETGLILAAGAWAMRRAALDHKRWTELGLAAPRVAVNVSAVQLRRRNFVDTLASALAQGAAQPGLDLEITESLVMDDIQGNIGKLEEARKLGVEIAIDDFGTGYSSLGYLARLPAQALKIDRSFIITMLAKPEAMTLVSTIISLAHSLRLKVIAEGVDDEEQAKVLRLLRCDQMQGFLFSKPVPFDDLTALLRA